MDSLESCRESDVSSEGCFARRSEEIYRASLLDDDATRHLWKVPATFIAKSETVTDTTNIASNRRQLLLLLKLRGFDIESLCTKSGGISGSVAGLLTERHEHHD